MKCPYCGFGDTKVLDSRPTEEGSTIRRRRECSECGRRFTTYERVEEIPLVVIKKDGRREVYDRNKILGGLIKACEKRPIPMQVLEGAVDTIERELMNTMEREVTSQDIGERVMGQLRQTDQVAYVRFASVYRQFKDLDTFRQELENLLTKNR